MKSTKKQLAQNQIQGLHYWLEDGSEVIYVGYSPKEGHFVYYTDGKKYEFALPHNTKFYE